MGDARRKKLVSSKAGQAQITIKQNNKINGKPLIISSPLNKSKHEMFSQTGKLNAQLEADFMLDENS